MGQTHDFILNNTSDVSSNELLLADQIDVLRNETDGYFQTMTAQINGDKAQLPSAPSLTTVANNRVIVWENEDAFLNGGQYEMAIIEGLDGNDSENRTIVLKDSSENKDKYHNKFLSIHCKIDPTP